MSNTAVFPQCENWTEAWLYWWRLPQALSRFPNEQECQHLPRPRQAANVFQTTCGQVLPGEALTISKESKALQTKLLTWEAMSSKPTSAALKCSWHLWLCSSGHLKLWWAHRGSTRRVGVRNGYSELWLPFEQPAPILWDLLVVFDREDYGSCCWVCFHGLVPIIPQIGVPEDPVVSYACLYPQGLACGFVLFILCLTFMRNHWGGHECQESQREMVNGLAGQMPFSKDWGVFLKHWGNCSPSQVHGIGPIWRQKVVLEK